MNLCSQFNVAEITLQVGYHGINVTSDITCVRIKGIIIMDLWIWENSWQHFSNQEKSYTVLHKYRHTTFLTGNHAMSFIWSSRLCAYTYAKQFSLMIWGHQYFFCLFWPHCNPLQGSTVKYRENPVIKTGNLQCEQGSPVMKAGFSLWELTYREKL